MVINLIRPSYQQGFARSAGESIKPNEWKGLVGAWKMSLGPTGTILRDFSGKGNHGTLTNMDPATDWVISGNSRLQGYCLDFDGTSDYVSTSFLELTGNPFFTVSAWVNFKTTASRIEIINFFGTNSDNQSSFLYRSATGKLVAEHTNGKGKITGSTTLSANIWYFCVVTHTPSLNSLYLNGVSDATPVNYTILNLLPAYHEIGKYTNGLYAIAKIDDVRIYNRVLTAAEIKDMYNYPNAMYTLRDRYSFMSVPAVGGADIRKQIILSYMRINK